MFECIGFQTMLNDVQSELEQIKEGTVMHKRRTQDMLSNILRDLVEVGTIVGSDMKVSDIKCHLTK